MFEATFNILREKAKVLDTLIMCIKYGRCKQFNKD